MVSNVIRLGSTLVLTRLLVPEVFGIMAISLVFMTAINMFSDLGLVPSIVRSPRGDDEEFLNTAWTLQALRGGFICVGISLIAWPASIAYDEPILFPILCALSLTALIGGFSSIRVASARRHMDFARVTQMEIIVQLASLVVNVLAAYWLRSPWALVIGSLFGAALRLGLSHAMLPPFQHRLRLEKGAFAEIARFGRWVLLATMLSYLGNRGIDGLMGLLVPLGTLGQITIAFTLAQAAGDLARLLLSNVVFPVMARIHRERPDDLPRTVARVRQIMMIGVLPAFALLAVLADPIADLLYDERYMAVGAYLALAALSSGISMSAAPNDSLLLTLGHSRTYSALMFINAVSRIAGLFIGFQLGGEYGMLIGLAGGSLAAPVVSTVWLHRTMRQSWLYEIVAVVIFSGMTAYLWQAELQPAPSEEAAAIPATADS